ncbi:AAA family ATPase [Pseudomonas farris]
MLRSLQLTNFTGYQSLQLELAPFTVLLGKNAYGKSSLLQAIYLLTKGLDVVAQLAPGEVRDSVAIRGKQLVDLATSPGGWGSLFTRSAAGTAELLAIQGNFSNGGWVSHAELSASLTPSAGLDVVLQVETIGTRPPYLGTSLVDTSALIDHVSTLRPTEVLLSDGDLRSSLSLRMQFGVVRNQFIRLAPDAIERLNRTLQKSADVEIVSWTSLVGAEVGAPIEVCFRRAGVVFEIASANHALMSTLELLCEVEAQISAPTATGERLLLLDEPENHLHPSAQAAVVEHLLEISRAAHTQIISVTHSDHMVRHLLSRTDSTILNIEKPFSRVRRLHTQKDLLKARPHELITYSAVNFLASRRVLLVEGRTDETILKRCALAYFGSSPDRLLCFEAWTCIPLDGVSNAPAADLIERLISSPMIPALERGDKLIVATVLDRDYEREALHCIVPGDQVDIIKHIWSRHSIESLFIDVDVLESLLLVAIGPSVPADLRERVQAAIAAADKDHELCVGAEDDLGEYFRRTRQYFGKAAQVAARETVRLSPADWHRGKDRAEFVLRHIRTSLPIQMQNKVRSSIAKLIESIPPASMSQVKVPTEVVVLLEELVAQGMQ